MGQVAPEAKSPSSQSSCRAPCDPPCAHEIGYWSASLPARRHEPLCTNLSRLTGSVQPRLSNLTQRIMQHHTPSRIQSYASHVQTTPTATPTAYQGSLMVTPASGRTCSTVRSCTRLRAPLLCSMSCRAPSHHLAHVTRVHMPTRRVLAMGSGNMYVGAFGLHQSYRLKRAPCTSVCN